MKASFLTIALLGLLVLGAPELRAQVYGPYYGPYWDAQYQQYLQHQHYLQWQQYLDYLRQYDPYYELHVLHYQLYVQPYHPNLIYAPCCYGIGIRVPSKPINRMPHAVRSQEPQRSRR